MFYYSVWSVITAHNLTPAKRDVTTVVSDQRSRFNRVSTINDYNTPDTVVKHRRGHGIRKANHHIHIAVTSGK